jgi:hypothetical protein
MKTSFIFQRRHKAGLVEGKPNYLQVVSTDATQRQT